MIARAVGAVLAGGRSRRLGRDKGLISSRGTTLIRRAVAVLTEVFPRVVLVAPARPGYQAPGVELIADRWPGAGPLAGIEAALAAADGASVFVLACDLPLVDVDLVTALSTVPAEFGVAAAAARLAEADGTLQPLCGLYSAACGPVFAGALGQGVRSMHDALREIRCQRFEVPAELLLNVNVEADVARLREVEAAWAR